MSDSVRPHKRQPTRLHGSWDSLGKNTVVGCHFLLQCMKVKSESEVAPSCFDSSQPHGLQPTRLLSPWDFPGKSTEVGFHCLLHNIRWVIEKEREFQKNMYFCFIGYAKAFDCVDQNKLCKILQEMWIPDHLNCLLRNVYAGQKATVRTEYIKK